jgi:hypothetical protein
MRALIVALFGSLVVSGPKAPAPEGLEAVLPPVPECVTVGEVGALPLDVQVGGVQVRFTEWMAKDAEATELIGFRASASGQVSFVVVAGGERFQGHGSAWQHPRGVVGTRVHGIEQLQLCRL